MRFRLRKGLTLPISGAPEQRIDVAPAISSVAVLGQDYLGLKPTMLVKTGDRVKTGQALFEDKKNPGVIVTAPGAGTVSAINRGEKRALLSVVIDLSDDEEAETFAAVEPTSLSSLDESAIRDTLQKSGLWTAFRSRPYSKVPAVDAVPHSIFVTAMDSNPLAADPAVVIEEYQTEFKQGLLVLQGFGKPVYICAEEEAKLPSMQSEMVQEARFSGPHPAGLPGTHIHYVDPVSASKAVWHIGYQDVIAVGKLFTSGQLWLERVVALGGPAVQAPRLLRTRLGANINELIEGKVEGENLRPISGSVFSGRTATDAEAWLGRYHTQVSVIAEATGREFMGWIAPGFNKFSALNVLASTFFRGKQFALNTSKNGSPRAIVPIGAYESVMPLDVLATPLIKALVVKDTDSAQALGALELDEEDLALCSYVDPGKHDFGSVLRGKPEPD